MALSYIDFGKADPRHMQLVQMLNQVEVMAAAINPPGTQAFIRAVDDFRNQVACEIENQGQRA